MQPNEIRDHTVRKARAILNRLRGLCSPLFTPLVVAARAFIINDLTKPGHRRFRRGAAGYGTVLAVPAAGLFGMRRRLDPDWDGRQIERRLQLTRGGR
jgi:hypothetical protein